MIDLSYPKLIELFQQHIDPNRSESASFLIWYLENYYRLDPPEAVDQVCDQKGDKGVDGIFVNDDNKTITIFQSRISQKNTSIGDASLRDFAGTLTQFVSQESTRNLMQSAGNAMLAALIKRLDLIKKIGTYEVRGEFVSNVEVDANGLDFLKLSPQMTFVGRSRLASSYISDTRDEVIHTPAVLDISGFNVTQYTVDASTSAVIAPIRATELVQLDGIANQSLFTFNVRGPLGNTGVNKDIVKSIGQSKLHRLFPLFHNGITVICRTLKVEKDRLSIQDYYVVNGCQSLTALFQNKHKLTDDLRVLTKFVQMDPSSVMATMVTEFSNNQNGVKHRDFMANNSTQIRLQNEIRGIYEGQYDLEIKRGEVTSGVEITNEDAGLLLMAFDLKQPWGTHRKYQVFDEKHAEIFGRPAVTADRIILCQVIKEEADVAATKLDNTLFGKYILTRYLLVYLFREILESTDMGDEVLAHPERFVRTGPDRDRFRKCARIILDDLIVDLNKEVKEYGKDFDYRDKLRDETWVKKISGEIVALYKKLVNRGNINSFRTEWAKP